MAYSFNDLPDEAKQYLVRSYRVDPEALKKHRLAITDKKSEASKGAVDLFSAFGAEEEDDSLTKKTVEAEDIVNSTIKLATDNYESLGYGFEDNLTVSMLEEGFIRPRVEKSKEEQKKRTKEKAEVFTPSWVCNKQNNLVDGAILGYDGAFNTVDPKNEKEWKAHKKKIKFDKGHRPDYQWYNYLNEYMLEAACGEGPYLTSRYDTVSGDPIPVRNSKGGWERIGLLDRKLRVVSENVDDEELWRQVAMYAFKATFGYEWQGDNLVLARLNMINTYVDYYLDLWGKSAPVEDIIEIAEIVSWNVWQMDGLKMIVPMSCSEECNSCEKKIIANHDGIVSVIKFGETYKTFESLGSSEWFDGKKPKK